MKKFNPHIDTRGYSFLEVREIGGDAVWHLDLKNLHETKVHYPVSGGVDCDETQIKLRMLVSA